MLAFGYVVDKKGRFGRRMSIGAAFCVLSAGVPGPDQGLWRVRGY